MAPDDACVAPPSIHQQPRLLEVVGIPRAASEEVIITVKLERLASPEDSVKKLEAALRATQIPVSAHATSDDRAAAAGGAGFIPSSHRQRFMMPAPPSVLV